MRRSPAGIFRRAAAISAAGALGAGLAACGSGAPSSLTTPATTTTTTTRTVTSSSFSAATTPARQPRAAAGSPGSPGSPGCGPGQTRVVLGQGTAGLGHTGDVLRLRNSSAQTCALTGYPGVALIPAGSGQPELQVARTPNGYLGGVSGADRRNPVVVLSPGQSGSALLEGLDSSQPGGGPCPKYAALLVTPPNQRVTVRLAVRFSICDPQIHPVVPGTTGRQG